MTLTANSTSLLLQLLIKSVKEQLFPYSLISAGLFFFLVHLYLGKA